MLGIGKTVGVRHALIVVAKRATQHCGLASWSVHHEWGELVGGGCNVHSVRNVCASASGSKGDAWLVAAARQTRLARHDKANVL